MPSERKGLYRELIRQQRLVERCVDVIYDLLDIVEAEYEDDVAPHELTSWKRAIKAAKAVLKKAEQSQ